MYFVHDFRGILYIGQALNLRRRFRNHWEHESNPLLDAAMRQPIGTLQFSWRYAPSVQLNELERDLIRIFNPPCNRTGTAKSLKGYKDGYRRS